MKALLQRVAHAQVAVNDKVVGRIEQGILVLLCFEHGDSLEKSDKLLDKLLRLRIFSDENGKMNKSIQDISGSLLIISQFTLAADCSSGTRPSFTAAATPSIAQALYDAFVERARQRHPHVQSGEFAADMQVTLCNDGPVTIPLQA